MNRSQWTPIYGSKANYSKFVPSIDVSIEDDGCGGGSITADWTQQWLESIKDSHTLGEVVEDGVTYKFVVIRSKR